MAQSPSSNDPYASIGAASADPYASIGGDPYAEIGNGPSPYGPEARQAAVQSEARFRQLREEADAAAALPKISVGIRKPTIRNTLNFLTGGLVEASPAATDEDFLVRPIDVPEELVAFGSEAIKSSPSTAAGIAAASAATPLASRLGAIPGPIGLAARGIPLAAGGVAAIGTRLAQEEYLPQILPEQLEQAYQVSSELAGRNPTAAMLGQFAGAAPFFRPGLPIGVQGQARVAVPAITGAIGGGIEGANQIASGEFAPERLAAATLGSALLNRETALGARIGPNLVLPNITARNAPSELDIVGRTMREPVLPGATDIAPAEFDAMRQAQAISAGETAAARAAGERAVANLDESIDAEKVRRLGERMAGKSPQDQLSILDQEMRLQKETLTVAEQRAGMDMRIALKEQIEQQKAFEAAAKAEQDAIKQAQAGIAEASAVPEIPKSQQILTEAAAPKPLANVATEVATQTKQSPYALQGAINEMTATPPAAAIEPTPPAALPQVVEPGTPAPATFIGIQEGAGKTKGFELYNLTQDIPGHNAGSTVSRETLEKAGFEVPKQAKAEKAIELMTPSEWVASGKKKGTQWASLYPAIKSGKPINAALYDEVVGGNPAENVPGAAEYVRDGSLYRPMDLNKDVSKMTEREVARLASNKLNRTTSDPMSQEVVSAANSHIGLLFDPAGAGLERVFGNPSYRATIDAMMKDSRDVLRKKYGDEITLYRAEATGESKRNIFSYALDRDTANQYAGIGDDVAAGRVRPVSKVKVPIESVLWIDDSKPGEAGARGSSMEVLIDKRDLAASEAPSPTAELRLNNAGIDLPPISSLTAAQKLAELRAAGVTTYKGKPIADANPAQLSAALGQQRRGQLERGAVSARALAPVATGTAGGVSGAAFTEREPGETEAEFQARRLRNIALGAAAGAAIGVGSIARSAKAKREAAKAAKTQAVPLPDVGPGQGIRRTAEKVIENRAYPLETRQVLADDPEIIYNKISRNQLKATVKGSTDEQLQQFVASPDINLKVAALAELGNRASVTPGMEAQAAVYRRELAKHFTAPAQILGLGNLVESPDAIVDAVEETLKLAVPEGKVPATLSPAVRKKLFDLATDSIRAEQAHDAAKAAAAKDFNSKNVEAFEKAEMVMGKAKSVLANYTKDILPERYGEIVSKLIKGNLLAPLSFAKNAFGNAAWQGTLRSAESVASGMDAVYSLATGRPRSIKLGSPIPSMDEMAEFFDGVRIAGKELLTGPGAESYIKAEVQRGFHPLRAMLQVIESTGIDPALKKVGLTTAGEVMERRNIAPLPRTPEGKVLKNDQLKKLIESMLGAFPETSFRLLNLGDKPVRKAVERRILNEQADMLGLTGAERERFIMFPDEVTQELVERESLGGVLAQENKLAKKVGNIADTALVDVYEMFTGRRPKALEDANKVFGSMAIPYRQFPANFAVTAVNFAVPPIAWARAFVQSKRGNRREAMRNLAEGTIGFMGLLTAAYLWNKGLISEPSDPKDKKRRSAQYEAMGAQRFNVTGAERLANGGDPTYRYGDKTVDWSSMGPMAASLYSYAKLESRDSKVAARTGEPAPKRGTLDYILNIGDAAGYAFDQSFLAGTSAIIDAMKDWENYGDKVMQNLFRAITSTVAPATLEAFARTKYNFIPEQRGDTQAETLKNIWNYKTMQLPAEERRNYKRDLWGNPVQRTPEGQNEYVSQFIDVLKTERKLPDPMKQDLLELYQQTGSTDAYPSLIARNFSQNGNTVELNADDYDMLQDIAGQLRENAARQITANPQFPKLNPEQKMMQLQKAYGDSLNRAEQIISRSAGFYDRYPELIGKPVPAGQESRLVARDIKARAINRMQRGEEQQAPSNDKARQYFNALSNMTRTEGDAYLNQQLDQGLLDAETLKELVRMNPQPKAAGRP